MSYSTIVDSHSCTDCISQAFIKVKARQMIMKNIFNIPPTETLTLIVQTQKVANNDILSSSSASLSSANMFVGKWNSSFGDFYYFLIIIYSTSSVDINIFQHQLWSWNSLSSMDNHTDVFSNLTLRVLKLYDHDTRHDGQIPSRDASIQ